MYKLKVNTNVKINELIEKRIEHYWNKRSSDFSRVRRQELSSINGEAWLNLISQHLPQTKPLNILDVGTGAGFFAILLASQGHNVTGIDMSPKMIHEAKKNMLELNCRIKFKQMNAQELDFADETFDVIVSRNLTWTLPDVVQAYREWYRVLKTGGIMMNFDSDYGDKNFLNAETCAKANINDEMLDECNDIKNALRISTHDRPVWDVDYLKKIGFNVTFEPDISTQVQRDDALDYDSVPLFAIYAAK